MFHNRAAPMVHDNSGCNISKIISFESNAKVDEDRWPYVEEEIIIKSEVGSSNMYFYFCVYFSMF